MRPVHIPLNAAPPQDWIDEAEALTEQLKNATDDKTRIAIGFAHRKLWRDKRLLNWLTGLHHHKCWYSEARESVSSYHVDHFRPKGRAAQIDGSTRAGYWWLTFNWKNYRISGQLLNVKKRDFFPVKHLGIASQNHPDTLEFETCQLIDPLKPEAWLISFERNDNGECLAGACPGVEEDELQRVEITIDVLGLNRIPNLNRNRGATWDQCLSRIDDYRNAGKNSILHTREALRLVAARELARLAFEEAEFSSVARACINKQAPQHLQLLVNELLQRPDLLKDAA